MGAGPGRRRGGDPGGAARGPSAGADAARRDRAPRRPAGSATGGAPGGAARPARARRGGPDRGHPAALPAGSSRGALRIAGRDDRGRPGADRPRTAPLPRPGRAGGGVRVALGDALDLEPAPCPGRLPLGSRADPRVAAHQPAGGGIRGLRRARGRGHPGARRGARRPLAPGRAPRAAGGGGGRLRPLRRAGGNREQDRPAPSPRVRGRGGPDRHRRQPAVGADQAGRACRRGLGRRRGGGAEERAGGDQPVTARAGREPGDAGTGRPHRL